MPDKRVTIAVYAPCVPTLQCGDFDDTKLRVRQMLKAMKLGHAMCNRREPAVTAAGVADHPLATAAGPDLAVFLGPEYFFRRSAEFYGSPSQYERHAKGSSEDRGVVNPHRVYSQAEKNFVLSELIAASREYPEMLIIPGSILWVEESTSLARQTVPIINNGDCTYYNKHEDAGELATAEKSALTYAGGSMSGIFEYSGTTMGLEVCKDHAASTLKDECDTNDRLLDLYFVISCGLGSTMRSQRPPVKNRGIHAICEGVLPSSARKWSQAVEQKIDNRWVKIEPRESDDQAYTAVYDLQMDG